MIMRLFSKKNKVYDKQIIKTAVDMAWPSVLESFFVAFAGLVDSFMVSSIGSETVAAVGLTTQPKFIGMAFFIAMNVALSALVARRKGEGNRDRANVLLLTALCMVFVGTAIISVVFTAGADWIIELCGSTADTHDAAVVYFRIIMGGMFFNVVQMAINAAQRGAGNTKITMTTNLTSSVVNIAANYLLIEGHLGFPGLGIRGAAIATVAGTVAGCMMSICSICRKDGYISVSYILEHKLKPLAVALKNLFKVGYSVFFEQILLRIGFMMTAVMAAHQGTNAMAAHQVGMNIMALSFSFGDGLQAAAVALIGYSLGKGDKELAKAYGKTCRMLGAGIAVVLTLIYFFGARGLYRLFFEEEEIIEIGVSIMHVIILVVIFQISQVIYMGCLRGAGDTLYTAVASTISVTLIRTIGSYVCGYVLGFGIVGIWMGVLFDQLSRFLFASTRFRAGKWTQIKI